MRSKIKDTPTVKRAESPQDGEMFQKDSLLEDSRIFSDTIKYNFREI